MVSKEDRKSFENGQKERDYISDHPIGYLLTGGVHSRPSDSSKAAAYDKGLRSERLDEDKGSGSSGDSGSSSGGSSCCYLTTACVDNMGTCASRTTWRTDSKA